MNCCRLRPLLLGASLLLGAHSALAQSGPADAPVPLKDFTQHAHIHDPALSPDGKYLAVSMDDADGKHHAIVIFRISDMQTVGLLKMPVYEMPSDITWVSPTRIVVEKARAMGSLDIPTTTGEIISADFDGKNQRYIYGYQGQAGRAATRARDEGSGAIAGVPP
ncbi:hypothetical protein [Oleiagrimonas soli]|uniref:Dipeptidyl aminopeptidase/acylaminoacyl peptidase n=1 Tax=Oleiagrimonas soli TaxID=1543381 RepID=A0A841KNV6_9GAMM|nr:hypothetical protein [Oleiagrimonas soli]MBB6185547.1 dipeptidyl aminopeptidase/acylaminoacyl peptidase [Oleiagrimonas soli]